MGVQGSFERLENSGSDKLAGELARGLDHEHRRLMDQVYDKQRHIYDLTRKYYLLGRDAAIARLTPSPGHHVLEVGCGTGRNLIAAARRYPQARFYGFDISDAMLETAHKNVIRAGLTDRITLVRADAASFDSRTSFGRDGFDRVLFSYTLSMIPPWREAVECGLAALSPGGHAVMVDFGQQERLPGWFRNLLRRWLKGFHVEPRAGMECAVLDANKGSALTGQKMHIRFSPLYRGYAWLFEVTLNAD